VTNSERADQLLADAEAIAGEMTHDPVPALIDTIRQRRVDADQAFLDRRRSLSRELADLRGPAFYQEIALREDQARAAVDGAEKALRFGRALIDQLRADG